MGVFGDWANKYFESGYIVLPVRPETKACEIPEWNLIFTKDMSEETLGQYASSHGDWGIGLVCGKASNVVAADFDWDGEHHQIYENMILGILPPTSVAKAGKKKWTRFYQNHESIKLKHIKWQNSGKNFFDIIGDGPGYTVLPPSIHSAGVEYKWITLDSILDIRATELPFVTSKEVSAIADIAALESTIIHEVSQRKSSRNDALFGFVWRHSDTAADFDHLISLAIDYDLKIHSKDPKGAYFYDKKYAKTLSAHDFASSEIRRWINYKAKKKSERGITWEVGCDTDYPTKINGFFKKIPKTNAKGEEISNANGEIVMRELPDFVGMAKYLKEREGLKTSEANSYIFSEDHYRTVTDIEIKNKCDKLSLNKCAPHLIREFTSAVLYKNFSPPNEFIEPEGLVNLKNGVLDVNSNQLISRDKSMFFKYVLPHEYNQVAECPNWLTFLSFVFEGNQDLADLSAEIFGYTLAGGTPWLHKAFFLSGSGRNGKSTWIEVLKALIGPSNFSSIPMGNLDKPFSVVDADGKLANIVGELDSKQLSSELFKIAVGGEELTAAHKGKPEYALKFKARLIFAMNNPPNFKDASAGNYEKLCILPFNRYITVDERDHTVIDRLLLELPGVLNWALEGLSRLKKRGRLPKISALDETLQDYRATNDSVYEWSLEYVQESGGPENSYILGNHYDGYAEWCKREGRFPVSKTWFVRNLSRELKARMPTLHTLKTGNKLKIKGQIVITGKTNYSM